MSATPSLIAACQDALSRAGYRSSACRQSTPPGVSPLWTVRADRSGEILPFVLASGASEEEAWVKCCWLAGVHPR